VRPLPQPGETLLGGAFTRHAGGKGANQAVAAALAVTSPGAQAGMPWRREVAG